ncbi:unnamed protein product [Chrysoparadoxa australica]
MVTISCYNRSGADIWWERWVPWEELFRPAYDQIRSFTQRPIGVAEMSSTSWGGKGDKAAWITEAFNVGTSLLALPSLPFSWLAQCHQPAAATSALYHFISLRPWHIPSLAWFGPHGSWYVLPALYT